MLNVKDKTTQDLKIALSLYNVSKNIKVIVFEELLTRYMKERDYNFYKFMITSMYTGHFYLGKSTIGVQHDMKTTLKLIDRIVQEEASIPDTIPQDHAKYLFAFVKETLVVMKELVKQGNWNGDTNRLKEQLEFFKTLMTKAKDHSDITTMFDNTIHMIEQQNRLLLGSGESKEKEQEKQFATLSLTAPLYKMSKKTLEGIVGKLPLYNEEDYYKIVGHVVSKYNEYELNALTRELNLGMLPLAYTFMNSPSEKINGYTLNMASRFGSIKKENTDKIVFYPLPVSNMDELFGYYEQYLARLESEGVLNAEEKHYLTFQFVIKNHHHTTKIAQRFVDMTTEFLQSLVLQSNKAKTVSEALAIEFTYTPFVEMLIKGDSLHKRTDLAFDVKIEKGEVKGEWKGTTTKVQRTNSWTYDIVPRENPTEKEWSVLHRIQERFIKLLKPFLQEESPLAVPTELLEVVSHLESGFYQLEINSLDKDTLKLIKSSDNVYLRKGFNQLVQYRLEHDLLTDKELKVLFSHDAYADLLDLRKIADHTLITLLNRIMDTQIVDIKQGNDLMRVLKLFNFGIQKRTTALNQFLGDVLVHAYPEQLGFAKSLAEPKEGETEEKFNIRQLDIIFSFTAKILETSGFGRNDKYYFD